MQFEDASTSTDEISCDPETVAAVSEDNSARSTRKTVTVSASLNKCKINATMDTGAGCSVIDYGSLEHIGLENEIKALDEDADGLINASGDDMDIVGVVDIPVVMQSKKKVIQEFQVLNSKTHSIVLLGRDYMSKFGTVEFDFTNKKVKLGDTLINCIRVDDV